MIDQLNALLNGPWGPIAILLGIGGLLILAAFGLFKLNVYLISKGTHPALTELLTKAIAMAWRASEQAIDAGRERLHGLDKKKIADGLYDTGGDLLMHLQLKFLPIAIDLRKYITREKWAEFVQVRFDAMTEELQELLDRMGEEGPPGSLPIEPFSVRRSERRRMWPFDRAG